MDPHERATSVWYRVAGLLRRKDLAIEIVEAEILLLVRLRAVLPSSVRKPAK